MYLSDIARDALRDKITRKTLTIENLIILLLDRDNQMKSNEKSESRAFDAKSNSRNSENSRNQKNSNNNRSSNRRNKSSQRDKCTHCEMNHKDDSC